MACYEINVNKKYNIPKDIKVVKYQDKYIVIAPEFANWIVLNTEVQVAIFNFFRQNKTIQDALEFSFINEDVNYVVTQLEARKFCDKVVYSYTDNERSMHLYLTNKCNLLCPHCYMYSGDSESNELTTDEIIDLIINYRTIAQGKSITISGGEPTIREDFDLIVKTASEIGLEVKLLTNGMLLPKERIDKIAKYINSVQISIDGYSEESNSLVRGKGHFQRALTAIEYFVNHGVETSIAMTPPYDILRKHQADYIKFAKQMMKKYSSKKFNLKFSETLSQGREVNPSKEQNEEYSSLVRQIQMEIYGVEYDLVRLVQTIGNNVITNNCMFGIFSVASNGNVYLCPEIGKLSSIANIRTHSFSDICKKSLIVEKATSVINIIPCKDCELRFICGGGCRIEEIPVLVNIDSFEDGIITKNILHRECDSKVKSKFYDLMIRSNEYLYETLD